MGAVVRPDSIKSDANRPVQTSHDVPVIFCGDLLQPVVSILRNDSRIVTPCIDEMKFGTCLAKARSGRNDEDHKSL